MTKKNNWMVGEAYKPSKERRAELRETMKVWDFHDDAVETANLTVWCDGVLPVGVIHDHLRDRDRLRPTVDQMDTDQPGLGEGDPLERKFLDRWKCRLENADGPDACEYR